MNSHQSHLAGSLSKPLELQEHFGRCCNCKYILLAIGGDDQFA